MLFASSKGYYSPCSHLLRCSKAWGCEEVGQMKYKCHCQNNSSGNPLSRVLLKRQQVRTGQELVYLNYQATLGYQSTDWAA